MRFSNVLVLIGVIACTANVRPQESSTDQRGGTEGLVDVATQDSARDDIGDAGLAGAMSRQAAMPCMRAPIRHRENAADGNCDHDRPPGDMRSPPDIPAGGITNCASDADCNAGENGRCMAEFIYYVCSYDQCFSDADCTNGGPCGCEEGDRYSDANICLPGNCRTDGDCGVSGYCSPTRSICGTLDGYYCHTCEDECIDNADCPEVPNRQRQCTYSTEVEHWICGSSGQCSD